jgi:phosphoribosylanthranilate isomerase
MPLKTVVKVGNISNLSDARYCAGMGVDMLGFCVIEGKTPYISPKLFQEIRGWISGPKVVAEIYGLSSRDQLKEIIQNYAPDYLELDGEEYQMFRADASLPCIVSLDKNGKDLHAHSEGIAYVLVNGDQLPPAATTPVLLKVNSGDNLLEKIRQPSITGIALNGSPELRPGFKNYDGLADILELLDE